MYTAGYFFWLNFLQPGLHLLTSCPFPCAVKFITVLKVKALIAFMENIMQ